MSEDRILHPGLRARLMSAEQAAALIQPGETVAMSGFTGSGYPKAVPQALAAHIDRGIKAGKLSGIGCIAGDDTIMIISKSPSGGAALAKAVDRFISDSGNMKRVK